MYTPGLEAWGGAKPRHDMPKAPPALIERASPAPTGHFAPSTAHFMINDAVDDMDAFLARLQAKGVVALKPA